MLAEFAVVVKNVELAVLVELHRVIGAVGHAAAAAGALELVPDQPAFEAVEHPAHAVGHRAHREILGGAAESADAVAFDMRKVKEHVRLEDRSGELDAVHRLERRLDRKTPEVGLILAADRHDPAAEHLLGVAAVDRAFDIALQIGDEHLFGPRRLERLNQFAHEERMDGRKAPSPAKMHLHRDGAAFYQGGKFETIQQPAEFIADRFGRVQLFRGESGK